MKNLYLLVLFNLSHFIIQAQAWQPCNIGVNGNSTWGTAVCVHNNKLFATNNSSGLQVSNDNGATWTVVNDSIKSTGVDLYSTGNRLYSIETNSGCALIRYSTDDGVSFQQDTSALPICYPSTPLRPSTSSYGATISWNNHMMMSLAGPDWEFSRNTIDSSWIDIAYFDANDCSEFFAINDTCWAATNGATSNGVAWSTDGINWTSPVSAGIPPYYVPTQIAWNSQRLFMMGMDVGAGNEGKDTILKFSDDYGLTFQDKNIKQYLMDPQQATTDIFSAYNRVYFTLSNNLFGSCPDLMVSTDNGQTFTIDTLGFPSIPSTVFEIKDMAFLNGWAFAQLNTGDLYRKQIAPTALEEMSLKKNPFQIYPNPATDMMYITPKENIHSVEIMNITGTEIFKVKDSVIDISSLPSSIYLIRIISTSDQVFYQKLIKK